MILRYTLGQFFNVFGDCIPQGLDKTIKSSVPNIVMISKLQTVPLFKSKSFLYEKYIEKGLSTRQIADEISSVHSTVLANLKAFNIPIREDAKPVQKLAGHGLAYGKKVINRKSEPHMGELENIAKMKELRSQGFSYWKIADIFNSMKIPTKTRKSKWQAATVMKIIDNR